MTYGKKTKKQLPERQNFLRLSCRYGQKFFCISLPQATLRSPTVMNILPFRQIGILYDNHKNKKNAQN